MATMKRVLAFITATRLPCYSNVSGGGISIY